MLMMLHFTFSIGEVIRSLESTFAFADNETETLFPRKGSPDASGS
jgi:hypothetical protein